MKAFNALVMVAALACATQSLTAVTGPSPSNGIYVWTDETSSLSSQNALIAACTYDPCRRIDVVLLDWDTNFGGPVNPANGLPANLQQFNITAHQNGLKVYALSIDAADITAVLNYNAAPNLPSGAGFDAYAMDFEGPWFSGSSPGPSTVFDIDSVYLPAKNACGTLPLHVSVGYHWDTLIYVGSVSPPPTGPPASEMKPAYDLIIDDVDSVDVQTEWGPSDPAGSVITSRAMGAVTYAASEGKPAWVTIETSDVSDATLGDEGQAVPDESALNSFYCSGEAAMWTDLAGVNFGSVPFTGFMLEAYNNAYNRGLTPCDLTPASPPVYQASNYQAGNMNDCNCTCGQPGPPGSWPIHPPGLSPPSAYAGGPSFTVVFDWGCLEPDALLRWNGVALPSFVVNGQLTAFVPSNNLVVPSGQSFATALITVTNTTVPLNPLAFTILSPNVSAAQSQVATAGQTVIASTAPTTPGQAGVSATLTAPPGPPGSAPVTVTAANYNSDPAPGTLFNGATSFMDVSAAGATSSDSLTANFYYASTLSKTAQANAALLYLTASGGWSAVYSSGGALPPKNTTNNLDGTVSGGRLTVVFDTTSTPTITELTGTPFAVAVDAPPPVITCPANIVTGPDPGQCSAVVHYTVSATTDNTGTPTLVCTPPSGSVFPLGVTTVNCTATDPAGNHSSCSFTVTVVDNTPPVITVPAPLTVRATSINGAVVTFTPTATDNCPGVEVTSSPASGALFPLGETTVTVTATDTSGNTASRTFTVTVLADAVLNGPLSVNAGTIEGSVELLAGNSVTLNGGASITGDLLAPGTPTLRENGQSTVQGTIAGSGNTQPSGYSVTLNGNSSLRYLRTRMNPISMPAVAAPPAPTGTRNVTLESPSQSPGNFSTVANLTLNGNVGLVSIPPGTYGHFTANGTSGFELGTAGSTQPALYNLQNLTLNGAAQVVVAGPVILVLANGLNVNGTVGASGQPAWLQLMIASGGVTLNGGSTLAALVTAPTGAVTINGNSQLIGALRCNQITINGSGLLKGAGD